MEVSVPPEVRAFLRDHIESHEELEILLLLQRRCERHWTAEDVAAELGIAPALARDALDSLHREGLLQAQASGPSSSFAAGQESPETTELIEKLGEAYRDHRFEIATQLANDAIERLRTRALRTFSDSFIIGRKRDRSG